jgi:hypothetical protein
MKKVFAFLALIAILSLSSFTGCGIYLGAPQIASFQSIPQVINVGDPATLIWAVSGSDSITISPDVGNVAAAGSQLVRPNATTTYTLTARNGAGTSSSSVTVTVNPKLSIVSFEANPARINSGGSSTLQWNVTGASAVAISPELGSVSPSGSRSVSPPSTRTYTLTASSGGLIENKSVTVEVTAPPVIAQFSANRLVSEPNQPVSITWSVIGARTIAIQPEIGPVPASGTFTVYPNRTTVYTLIATSDCCVVNRTITVQVAQFPVPSYLPVIQLFDISPDSIYKGSPATLRWIVSNADNVTIDQGVGPVGLTGNLVLYPQASTFYTLKATNSFGFRQVTIGIIVFNP